MSDDDINLETAALRESVKILTLESDALRRELGEEQGAHETIAAMCFAHGAESGDGTSKTAVRSIIDQLAAAQKEIERQEARITALRSGLLLIAGSGCEGEDPEQLCKEFELQMTSFCIPCKAAYFLESDDKPSAIAQAKGAE